MVKWHGMVWLWSGVVMPCILVLRHTCPGDGALTAGTPHVSARDKTFVSLLYFDHHDKCAMSADQELSSVLQRRQSINDALEEGKEVKPRLKVNVFAEFSRQELKQFEQTFKKMVSRIKM
ncbi:EF-hand domain-containing protein D2-like protein [Frankliniella fusca]|uniref:EF-hand domain-containing protein D2-like protein n=1 Tax=Frankliniella fusca TaxID=407009 RepID=A0AAE1LB92_9NEOP|nr:EF-hand domain-containing protein D2-like protein [Frankliniella fusca]